MTHEREIEKELMLRGIDSDIPVLPIPDAVTIDSLIKSGLHVLLRQSGETTLERFSVRVDAEVEVLENYLPAT